MPSKDIKASELPSPDELAKDSGQELSASDLPSPEELNTPRLPATQAMQIAQAPTGLQSAARGAGQGITFGTQPILAGAGAAGMQAITGNQGPKPGRNLEALMAAYKEMRNQEMAKNAAAQQANPKTFGAGEIAGGLPTAIATGGTSPGMGVAAAQGAAAGLGNYLGTQQNPTPGGAAVSTGVGAAGGAAMQKVLPVAGNAVADLASGVGNTIGKVIPQGVKEGFNAGLEGINVLSKKARQMILPEEAPKAADDLTKRMLKANDGLRTDIDGILTDATKGGQTINREEALQNAQEQLKSIVDDNSSYADPTTDSGKSANKLFGIIQQYKNPPVEAPPESTLVDQFGRSPISDVEEPEVEGPSLRMDLTPIEMRDLASEVGEYAGVLSANGESKLARIAYNFSSNIKNQLRQSVPDYADAADRLTQFQKYFPETIMSKGNSAEDSGVRLSNSASQYLDIKDPTQAMIQNLAKDGPGSDVAKRTFNKLDDSLNALNKSEAIRAQEAKDSGQPFVSVWDTMGLNKDEIMRHLESKAQRVAAYDSVKTGTLPVHTPTSIGQTLTNMANKTGVVIGNIGGLAYNAPKDVLYAAAQKLSSNPAVAHLGVGLKAAVASGDLTKQNAAIFAIMQNPAAKSIIDPNFKEESNDQRTPKKQPYGTYGF